MLDNDPGIEFEMLDQEALRMMNVLQNNGDHYELARGFHNLMNYFEKNWETVGTEEARARLMKIMLNDPKVLDIAEASKVFNRMLFDKFEEWGHDMGWDAQQGIVNFCSHFNDRELLVAANIIRLSGLHEMYKEQEDDAL